MILVGNSHTVSETGSQYADTLIGGHGNETLTGNGGGDTFVFKTNMAMTRSPTSMRRRRQRNRRTISTSARSSINFDALEAATTDGTNSVIALPNRPFDHAGWRA